MVDKEMLRQELDGRRNRGIELARQRDVFLRAQGLDVSIEKEKAALVLTAEAAKKEKARLADLQAKKNATVGRSLNLISATMTDLLPRGLAVVELDEASGGLFIGWIAPDTKARIAHASLSGGERVSFDAAFAHALGANIIVGEFAELDDVKLPLVLSKMAGSLREDAQAIVISCHDPGQFEGPWNVVRL